MCEIKRRYQQASRIGLETESHLTAIVLREGTTSFRAVGNHAGLFWLSIYRFNVSNGASPAVPA